MADRPNVLLICTDHWPGKMIGALGHPDILTPTLGAAIASGVAFTKPESTEGGRLVSILKWPEGAPLNLG